MQTGDICGIEIYSLEFVLCLHCTPSLLQKSFFDLDEPEDGKTLENAGYGKDQLEFG